MFWRPSPDTTHLALAALYVSWPLICDDGGRNEPFGPRRDGHRRPRGDHHSPTPLTGATWHATLVHSRRHVARYPCSLHRTLNRHRDPECCAPDGIPGSGGCRAPVTPRQIPGAKISDADREALTVRIQFGGDEVRGPAASSCASRARHVSRWAS